MRKKAIRLVSLDDMMSSGELRPDAQLVRRATRRASGAVGMLSVASISLVGGLIFTVGSMIPALDPLPSPDPPTEVVASTMVRVAGPTSVPAHDVVSELVKHAPAGVEGSEVSAGGVRIAPIPGMGCIEGLVTPVSQASRAWASGSGKDSTGLTYVVSAFAAGQGGYLMEQAENSDCTSAKVIRIEGGADVLQIASPGRDVVLIRRGDVVVALDGRGTTISAPMAADVAAAMSTVLAGAGTCVNPESPRSDSTRSPYVAPDDFTGFLVDTEVLPVDPPPAPVAKQELPGTAEVVLPEQPDFPFWPLALPEPVPRPDMPQPPAEVMSSKLIKVRVEDKLGPGCGWDFTGQVQPEFDQAISDEMEQRMIVAAQKEMADDAVRYTTEATAYGEAVVKYIDASVTWNTYAVQVAEIATAWKGQRDAQQTYATQLANYNRAVNEYNSFVGRKQAAQRSYDDQVVACSLRPPEVPTTTVTVRPTPTNEPTSPPVTQTTPPTDTSTVIVTPSPTAAPSGNGFAPFPMQQLICPPVRPAILDQSPPTIPPLPTPPPDPRPEGSR